MALNDYFLDPKYLISSFHTIAIGPNSAAQPVHHDDGYTTMPRPRPPMSSAIIVAFDEFTEQNGATGVIPGSHLWAKSEAPDHSKSIPAVCPAGSVIYFIGTLWHHGGANNTSVPRQSLTVQYCQPYVRQIENQFLAVDPRRLDEMDPRIVRMLGYDTFSGFIGYADGLNPRAGARRMVRWLSEPLADVPTWAQHDEGATKHSKL